MSRTPKQPKKIPVVVTYTEGYQERFTKAILDMYTKQQQKAVKNNNEKAI